MQNRKKKTQIYRTVFLNLWEKARVGCFKRTALKPVYYLGWNRSPAQVGCMRQALGPGALGRPRGIGWRGRWEGGLGWGTHVNPWLFHFNVWQNPPQIKNKKKLQYFDHLMWRAEWIIGKDLDVGKDWGGRKGGDRGWNGWMASLTQWTWVWTNSRR